MANSIHDVESNKGARQGMVSIGTYSIALNVSGPDRLAEQPVVLIMHGLGGTMSEWPAARRCISSFTRVLDYDRSGLRLSEEGSDQPTALTAVRELSTILEAIKIAPPYIIVAYSWGAILSLEFMNSRLQDIFGIVFADGTAPHFGRSCPCSPRCLR